MSTCTFFFLIVDSINLKPETLYLSIYPVLNNAEDWASAVLWTACCEPTEPAGETLKPRVSRDSSASGDNTSLADLRKMG